MGTEEETMTTYNLEIGHLKMRDLLLRILILFLLAMMFIAVPGGA